ncbi:hypothetical protein CSUI_003158, partial [Cystoisospora suis]
YCQRGFPTLEGALPGIPRSQTPSPFDLARERLDRPSTGARFPPTPLRRNEEDESAAWQWDTQDNEASGDGSSLFRSHFYMKYPTLLPALRGSFPTGHFLYLPSPVEAPVPTPGTNPRSDS